MSTTPSNDVFIPAAHMSAELLTLTGNHGPGRRKLIELAASAKIPMVKPGREWGCYRAQLPEIAKALGLSVKVQAPQPNGRRRQSASAIQAA